MTTKERKDPKKESLLREREDILHDVEAIDAALGDEGATDIKSLIGQLLGRFSFTECINWLQPFVQGGLSDMPARLGKLVAALEEDFPGADIEKLAPEDASKLADKLAERFRAYIVIKLFIDNSLILYAVGRNGAAIVELNSTVERQAIERLLELIVLPERIDVARRVFERLTLQDLTPMLLECGIIEKDDLKFAERLGRLRNGLAHRNPRIISNAILSGQQIREQEIETVVSDLDYVPYAIGAIRFLIKTVKWDETA